MEACQHNWEERTRTYNQVRFKCRDCGCWGFRHQLKPNVEIRPYRDEPFKNREPRERTVGYTDRPTAFRDQEDPCPALSRRWRDPGKL